MLDSLDLNSLAEVIQRNRRTARYRWLTLATLLVGMALISIVLMTASSPTRNGECNCLVALTICNFLPFVATLGAFIVFALNRRRRRNAIKKYETELGKLNLPTLPNRFRSMFGLVIIGWPLFCVLIVVFFDLNLISAFFLAIIPLSITTYFLNWTIMPLSRGNYDEVFRRWERVEKISFLYTLPPFPPYALAHIYAGNAAQSEKIHLQLLVQALNVRMSEGVALNNYACELLYQGRYEEAKSLLEMTIMVQPEMPFSYESLARWYLRQNLNPERASELSKFGLDLPLPLYVLFSKILRAVGMATFAWSEARLGHVEKAHELLNKALKSADSRNVPYFALINYTAGETQLALGDTAAAKNHFKHAADVDPQGRFGNMAKQKLVERLP